MFTTRRSLEKETDLSSKQSFPLLREKRFLFFVLSAYIKEKKKSEERILFQISIDEVFFCDIYRIGSFSLHYAFS